MSKTFTIEVPHKRDRNPLAIAQAKGEGAPRPQRMLNKKEKGRKNKKGWKNEDWGVDNLG